MPTAAEPTMPSGGVGDATAHAETEGVTPAQLRRLRDRHAWQAFWKMTELDSRGTIFPRFRYYLYKAFDFPVTQFREKVAEPLQDRYKLPYYQRRRSRAPEIDECSVRDYACIYEANEQFRLDKNIDWNILNILQRRIETCLQYNNMDASPCAQALEDYEEAELNHFIKYGELGVEADARDAYMKMKHRLVWERRHPEIMAERERLYNEHKEKIVNGHYDMSFWKTRIAYQDKAASPAPYMYYDTSPAFEHHEHPVSKDPQYYKQAKQEDNPNPNESTPEKGPRIWPWS